MSSPVKRWSPKFTDALRLAARPLIAYFLFSALAFVAFVITILFYDKSDDLILLIISCAFGMAGVLVGQLIAVARLRVLPIFIVASVCSTIAGMMLAGVGITPPKELLIPIVFFCFAFPCGLLSLQHRYELFAAFWPSIGFIGSAISILNHEGRVKEWEENKISVWMPVPLALLGAFLLTFLLYLAAKQAMRVQLWQALSGSLERRVSKKTAAVSAVPRRNLLPLLVIALVLFGFTAVMAPYIWRTGKGDRDGGSGRTHQTEDRDGDNEGEGHPRPPKFDEEALRRMMQSAASGAKSAAMTLWPLLLLFVFYRPIKRALLTSHLKTPIVPTPPSERVDNLWEYLRISAEDAGVVPTPSDSVEDLLERIKTTRPLTPELIQAAAIYEETRYGFVVKPGAPKAMKTHAVTAASSLKSDMTKWDHVKSWWRPLS